MNSVEQTNDKIRETCCRTRLIIGRSFNFSATYNVPKQHTVHYKPDSIINGTLQSQTVHT
jgi:hypothetical protein